MDKIQNEELETSQNQEEDLDSKDQEEEETSQKNETTDSTDDVEELKKKVVELEEKNKQLYERAKKGEIKSKGNEAKLIATKNELEKQGVRKEDTPSDPVNAMKLFHALKDFSPEEVEYMSKQARVLGKDIIEVAKDDDIKLFIEAKREKIKNDKASIVPGSRQSTTEKSFSDWTANDIQELTSNPNKENIAKLDEYRQWARKQK